MANRFKVKAVFVAAGNFAKKFKLWERAAARFGKGAEKSFRLAGKSAKKFNQITAGFLKAQVIGKGVGLLTQGIGSVVTQFIAFDKAALGATVRFKDIGPEAANFNEQLKKIEKSARDAGATTQFTAAQAAAGLDFFARAGFTSAEAMLALVPTINLALATGEDFNSVADKSSDLLGAFGLNADNTAEKIANLNRLNDVLVKSANSANVTIETMFETMKQAAPIGRKLGIELEEVAALTAILGNAGIKGTEAGTALKNMFLRLTAATPATAKMIRSVGVEIDDGTGNMRKFTDIMSDLSDATAEFGTLKVAKVLDTLFGKRAIAGAANIGDSIEQLKDLEQVLKNAGGTSKLTAEIMGRSIEAKLLVLSSTATEFGFKILEAFRGDAAGGIDSLAESIRNMDVKPIIEDLKIVLEVLKATLKFAGFSAKVIKGTGEALGGAAARTRLALTGDLDPTAAFKREVQQRQVEAAGFGVDLKDKEPQRVGPNQAEAAARFEQAVRIEGQINLNGFPEGTTAETGPAPGGFQLAGLGQN